MSRKLRELERALVVAEAKEGADLARFTPAGGALWRTIRLLCKQCETGYLVYPRKAPSGKPTAFCDACRDQIGRLEYREAKARLVRALVLGLPTEDIWAYRIVADKRAVRGAA